MHTSKRLKAAGIPLSITRPLALFLGLLTLYGGFQTPGYAEDRTLDHPPGGPGGLGIKSKAPRRTWAKPAPMR